MATIQVTQKHIDEGRVGDCDYCPVALAITEAVEGWAVSVGDNRILFIDKLFVSNRDDAQVVSPETVSEFVASFDNDGEVKPFSFELDLSALEAGKRS